MREVDGTANERSDGASGQYNKSFFTNQTHIGGYLLVPQMLADVVSLTLYLMVLFITQLTDSPLLCPSTKSVAFISKARQLLTQQLITREKKLVPIYL